MEILETEAAFKACVQEIQNSAGYKNPLGFGICRVDFGQLDGSKILQATYPHINWNENFGSAAIFIKSAQEQGFSVDFNADEVIIPVTLKFLEGCLNAFTPYSDEAFGDAHKNIQVISALYNQIKERGMREGEFRLVILFNDVACTSVEGTYLKLYALSTSKAALRSLNLNGAFGALHNVAWSDGQPIELEWLRENEIELKFANEYPKIDFVDKFPRYLQHIIPANNTRVLDDSKVRFGAQLHAGTTIMPGASYVNFNAGTTGVSMVEGRISSSAVVGDGSDVGGGASILGVLSGTDGIPVTIGKNTLLGANSVTGIALGDGCIVDAGIAVLAGTKFAVSAEELSKIQEANPTVTLSGTSFKGKDLVALNGIHYRQDSTTGQLLIRRSTREVKLNADLH
ncbi:MAG: 2,3,4,5-tetrahydropyridine-2,6-carboxylate N-succinyltransferase [Sulfuricurvum sp. GWF2_44_89]|uniref:tetrahydrodipicolinate N-succinyltransferase N-terminal domain-containing protein n=1 Tax=unclassified Sulfuricurvum TaxID=2632390 RepID=UPI0008ACED0F|nr:MULTISPECIES: tetrahydrodipicolinate N-succinyltransferase N-terminal domain-containing protein [unclassified Sulfuricurvum]OHD79361.1 MAG: 2,3,4,5-tetrahydropyridine-2,6-carboxylate N-succinyltransferase [Sulfuricurvum sp. GWF2_44_89]OHD91266.1 MAG: 2,3,4,5-tetrahydropyridine-2,6-carboxylate N-succinyltransferase [Sulfuricurvum sp. RIFOXYD12_FULL_44_77]OHD92872.1 MAG: 2,3,4,5-tetrahydropyridine-2,6-carboxylate N-succinyltransferase [Sulfuricurvum sp. RIFOXYD2_FULL_44_160]